MDNIIRTEIPKEKLLYVVWYDWMNEKMITTENIYFISESKRFFLFADYSHGIQPLIMKELIKEITQMKFVRETESYKKGINYYFNPDVKLGLLKGEK